MPKTRTNSVVVTHHEDGSWTEQTDITYLPPTTSDKLAMAGILGAGVLFALSPVVFAGYDLYQEKREARKARKAALSTKDD
jgi:hypothetical protein